MITLTHFPKLRLNYYFISPSKLVIQLITNRKLDDRYIFRATTPNTYITKDLI